MKEILFIVNPQSARGRTQRTWPMSRRQLSGLGIIVSEHVTAGPGEATEVARQALSNGTQYVAVVGGDGTLNEVVNGYLDHAGKQINPDAALGLLPSGTGSDFCRSFGICSGEAAARVLAGAVTRTLDAVRLETQDGNGNPRTRFYINVSTCGLGGDVAGFVNQWRTRLPRWVSGRARFVAAVLRALNRYRNSAVRVCLDGERELEVMSNLIVVGNGRFAGGGMMLAPNAQPDDGLLDVVVTNCATRFDVIKELPRIRRGGYLDNPRVSAYRASVVSIVTETPLAIDADGEPAGFTPARFSILPSAVRFML